MNTLSEKLPKSDQTILDRIYDSRYKASKRAEDSARIAGETIEISFFEFNASTALFRIRGRNLLIKGFITTLFFLGLLTTLLISGDQNSAITISLAFVAISILLWFTSISRKNIKDPSALVVATENGVQVWKNHLLKNLIPFDTIAYIDCEKSHLTETSYRATMYDRRQKKIATLRIPDRKILVRIGAEIIRKSKATRLKK